MRRSHVLLYPLAVLVLLSVGITSVFAQEATDEPEPEVTLEVTVVTTDAPADPAPSGVYVVQPGDNLFRIALRNGVSLNQLAAANGIVNPQLIFVGQQLTIPGSSAAPTPAPADPPADPPATGTHTVVRGETLGRIAAQYNTTINALISANPTLVNPNVIYVGQQITLPGSQPQAPVGITVDPDLSATVEDPGIEAAGFAYGIEVFFEGQDAQALISQVNQLDMEWVKVRVDWRLHEPEQGEFEFEPLDQIVTALDATDVNVMFTVTNSPNWARTSQDENGPPDDLNNYFNFVEELATRYEGRVDAYQIWDEPNLRRNWNCERRMCDTDYLFMLGETFALIRTLDDDAQIISAGLAPTRFNDRINAVDDRLYLETLLSRGLDTVVDGIGVHPGGEANPPDAECCDQPPGVDTHYENDSFYFGDNLAGYRDLVVRYGAAEIPLWVTKFGWGTGEDIANPPANPNQPHYSINYTSLSEQAIYIPRAFDIGQELGYVGPMFLFNLNGCDIASAGGLPELCYTSLVAPGEGTRPVFTAVQAIDKMSDADEGDDMASDEVENEAGEETESMPEDSESMTDTETGEDSENTGSLIQPIPFDEPEATEEPGS